MPTKNDSYFEEQRKNEQLVREKTKEVDDQDQFVRTQEAVNQPVSEPVAEQPYDENTNIVNNVTTQPAAVIPPTINPEDPGYYQGIQQPIQAQAPVQAPVVPEPTPQQSEADALIQSIFTSREPQPVVDQAKIDRLKRMGNLNSLAQSLNVLGDIFALSQGGSVNKRQPDRTAPMIYQQLENIMDRSKAEQDAWKHRDFQTGRENEKLKYGEAVRKEGVAQQNKRYEAQVKQLEADKAENLRRYENGEISKKEAEKATAQYRKDMIAARRGSGSGTKKDKTIKIRTDKEEYEMTPSEYSYHKGRALKNLELLKKKFPTWVVTVPEVDEYGDPIPRKFVTKLDSHVKDDDLVREQKILDEEEAAEKAKAADTAPVMLRGVGKQPTTAQPTKKYKYSNDPLTEDEIKITKIIVNLPDGEYRKLVEEASKDVSTNDQGDADSSPVMYRTLIEKYNNRQPKTAKKDWNKYKE